MAAVLLNILYFHSALEDDKSGRWGKGFQHIYLTTFPVTIMLAQAIFPSPTPFHLFVIEKCIIIFKCLLLKTSEISNYIFLTSILSCLLSVNFCHFLPLSLMSDHLEGPKIVLRLFQASTMLYWEPRAVLWLPPPKYCVSLSTWYNCCQWKLGNNYPVTFGKVSLILLKNKNSFLKFFFCIFSFPSD